MTCGVDRGHLGGDLCGCAVKIGGGRGVSDALCRWDWPISGLWCGCRCAVVIGGECMVWVSLCRCDWRGERGVGGAMLVYLVLSRLVSSRLVLSCSVTSCDIMPCLVVSGWFVVSRPSRVVNMRVIG